MLASARSRRVRTLGAVAVMSSPRIVEQLQPRIPRDLAERDDDLQVGEVRDFIDRGEAGSDRLLPAAACSPAARIGPPRRYTHPSAAIHRRCAATWRCWRSPARLSAAIRKSPDAPTPSPVNTRPVRFAPCAAGASPRISMRAFGSPKPGTGRAQYTSFSKGGLPASARPQCNSCASAGTLAANDGGPNRRQRGGTVSAGKRSCVVVATCYKRATGRAAFNSPPIPARMV